MTRSLMMLAAVTLGAGACDGATGPEDGGVVHIAFATQAGAGTVTSAPSASVSSINANVVAAGTNGTLDIARVHMIVKEIELEGAHQACLEREDDGETELDDCEEFEGGPFLLNLPLDADPVTVVTESVPEGSYTGFEIEVEPVSFEARESGDGSRHDDDEDDEDVDLSALVAELLALHADWPDDASLVVEGTFTPDEGEARPFRVFVDAEIEIEMAFDEPLEVGPDRSATITVYLDPGTWFIRPDGSVLDLSAFDYHGDESDILEIEAELEDGVTRIEVERD